MFRTLKVNLPDNRIWISGCSHFNHVPDWHPSLYESRGFKTIQEHDKWLLNKYAQIPYDSVLFLLGDFALNSTPENVESIFAQIPCKKYYVSGNHESQVSKYYKKLVVERFGEENQNVEVYPLTDEKTNLTFLGAYAEVILDKQFCVLSHFPLAIWNKSHHGAFNLHSHNHGSFKESLPNYPDFKRLDCGVDVFNGPVCFNKVKEIMAKKNIKQLDHHNKDTN